MERAYAVAIERLMMRASAAQVRDPVRAERKTAALRPGRPRPAPGDRQAESERAGEPQDQALPPRAPEEAKTTRESRPPETRDQMASLRAVANAAAAKAVNGYVGRRRTAAKAALVVALACLMALAATAPSLVGAAAYGLHCTAAALLLNALVILRCLVVLRRLGKLRLVIPDARLAGAPAESTQSP